MKASESQLLKVLRSASQFDIPIYQRTYSWDESQCQQLWADILRAGADPKVAVHFIGSIVYVESGQSQVTSQVPLQVIDGQQRLTTVSLLIAALAEAVGDTEPLDGFSARKLRNYYLVNPEETGDRRYKLLLTQTDRDSLIAIVDQAPAPAAESVRIRRNYQLFQTLINKHTDQIAHICAGIAKLYVVDLALTRGQDNPQLIFESMNSTGLALSQADLIRNYVLMGQARDEQERLYRAYWRPIETDFGQEAYGKYFDGFMRDYLTVKTGSIPRKNGVYEAFKAYAQASTTAGAGADLILTDLREYSNHYRAVVLGAETDPGLRAAFADLRELKVEVANPFLLEVYADRQAGLLTTADMLRIVRLVESYVFRRAVCAIPTNSLNKTFATLARGISKSTYATSVEDLLMSLPSYRRFPRDEEFTRELTSRDMYNFRRGTYWLRRLENHGRKEPVPVGEYTIEHVMPQNPDLPQAWRAELGEDWRDVHPTWLNTVGNLTLTGYNSEYSDRPFTQKRDMEGGFADSPLRLNRSIATADRWDAAAIEHRAELLAQMAVGVWAIPDREPAPKPAPAEAGTYTLADHPHLAAGPVRDLFDALREAVLGLDECVTMDVLKLYVAFKAETNFVDVVPQSKRLRLSLNMAYPAIHDPRGICRDITNIGRWGNGDIEVALDNQQDLPYILGLIRQSLDRQVSGNLG